MSQFRATQPRTSRTSRADGLAAALFAGSPVERTALTLGTGLILFVLCLVYSQAMRGLRPSDRPARTRPTKPVDSEASLYLSSEDQGIRRAVKYLPKTWVPQASHCVQTSDGRTYCYFNEWTKESAKVLRFTPFAMISTRKGDKPEDQPYTVVSDKAYVTFKDEVSPSGKNPGAVQQAGLEGKVEITGPNNLRIIGRNFSFEREEMRIYSDNRVEIFADKHRATAKGIQIELIAEHNSGRSDDTLAISGVSSVKLLQDVYMTLVSSGDSAAGPLPGIAKPANPADPANKAPRIVRTHCDGSFVFYLESRIATFERNVRIRRETSPGQFDALFADENVEITFEKKPDAKKPGAAKPPDAKQAADAKPAPANSSGMKPATVAAADKTAGPGAKANGADPAAKPPGGLESNLTFKSIHAQGKIVELTSDSNGMRSQMRDLTYDQTAREAKLTWLPREGDPAERTVKDKNGEVRKVPAENRVWVMQRGSVLKSQKIQLNHDPQGEVTHVMCLGEGEMRHVEDKTGEVDLAAYWHKEMRKFPDPKSPNFDLIHLEEALIEQPKQGAGIAANFIRLWLLRQSRTAQTAHANKAPVRKGQQPPQPSGPHLDHMLAWQKVAMVSPQIECDTDRLEIWFEDAPGAPNRGPVSKPRQRANLVPTSERVVRGGPMPASFASTTGISASPAGGSANATSGGPAAKKNPNDLFSATGSSEPYNLTAARVRVHIIQFPEGQGQQPQVADMLAWENVQLTQAHADAADPLVINGNVLEVHNRGELDQEMIVYGQPAHVRDRGAHIEGGHIVFNRLRSTADVDGPGRLQLPVQSDAQAQGGNRQQPKGNEQPLDVEWHQKMHFDGKTAHFLVNVHTTMTDATSQSEIRCLNMDVTLTKPYSFTQQTPEADRPAVDTVFCQGNVEFESQATQDDQLAEVRRGRFMDLLVHKITGKSTANGPGMLRVWRHNENGQSGISQFTMAQSNTPPKARKSSKWEFNEVDFVGTMDGDFLDAMSGRSRPKTSPKIQQASSSNALLGSSGAWMAIFRDHVEVIYGPVDQPMELVSRDDLSEEAGCLLCEYLQVRQVPQAGTDPQHIEMLSRGNAKIEGKTFTGESDTITYDGSKSLYVLIGDSSSPAHLWRQIKIGAAQTQNLAKRIFFNPITHMVKEDGAQGFDMQR
jgi:hypothetical protein